MQKAGVAAQSLAIKRAELVIQQQPEATQWRLHVQQRLLGGGLAQASARGRRWRGAAAPSAFGADD